MKQRTLILAALALAALAAVLTGCGGDSPPGPEDVVGKEIVEEARAGQPFIVIQEKLRHREKIAEVMETMLSLGYRLQAAYHNANGNRTTFIFAAVPEPETGENQEGGENVPDSARGGGKNRPGPRLTGN